MPTRDILYVCAELVPDREVSAAGELSGGGAATDDGESAVGSEVGAYGESDGESDGGAAGESAGLRHIHILVNHHPSKFSGEKASMHGRELAMVALRDVCDSIARVSDAPIVAMGDFNDTPDGPQFSILEGRLLNLAGPLAAKGEGSIRYNGRWELIDHFLVGGRRPVARADASGGRVGRHCNGYGVEMSVVRIPFLMTRDRAHSGFKPLRTYSGPRWIGGVSDHCPILLDFAPR